MYHIYGNYFRCLNFDDYLSFISFSVILPGAELRYDSVLSTDDMERFNGSNWERESYCSGPQVSKHNKPFSVQKRK